jgi:BASS family bile acid:Na+ symporter
VVLSTSLDEALSFPAGQVTAPLVPRLPTSSSHALKWSFQSTRRRLNDNMSNSMSAASGEGEGTTSSRLSMALSKFTLLAPVWTTLAALLAISNTAGRGGLSSSFCKIVGSLPVMQKALVTLMFAMGLTITPKDISSALGNPSVLAINAVLCYGMMPLLAIGLAKALSYSPSQTAGIVLLGSVSGGQASNLFTLIAGGDVALSVICTLSTTLLGVLATPLLIRCLLGCSVVDLVDGRGVLESVASLVLVPLACGLGLGRLVPKVIMEKASPFLPTFGVLATLVLVAGGASNSISSTTVGGCSLASILLPSCLLSCLGGVVAWLVAKSMGMEERSKRTLVMETFSKSPTLAYLIGRKHFGPSAAAIPAAAMVTLAVLGALIASIWSSKNTNSETA